jgi:uncharacterized membrane protein YhaH (DUF805 family)
LGCLLASIGYITTTTLFSEKNEHFRRDCIAQGILIQFGDNAIFAWNTAIAIALYVTTCHDKKIDSAEKFFHISGWGWAFFSTFIPFVNGTDVYDKAGVWCWFPRKYFHYRMLLFYAPFLIQVLIISYCYISVIKKLKFNSTVAKSNGSNDEIVILGVYPIIFFVCYIFPTINRLYEASTSTENFVLFVLHSLTASSVGLVNSIAYGFDEKVKDLWENFFCCRGKAPVRPKIPTVQKDDVVESDCSNTDTPIANGGEEKKKE